MTFALTPEQLEIRDAVARLCERFGDDYWLKKDTEGGFPHEFHRAMAEGGWLGVAMPEEFGGGGPRHHRGGGRHAGRRAIGRRVFGRLGGAHEHLRPPPGRRLRHATNRNGAFCRR